VQSIYDARRLAQRRFLGLAEPPARNAGALLLLRRTRALRAAPDPAIA
jgi:hypothetical protein